MLINADNSSVFSKAELVDKSYVNSDHNAIK